MKTHPKKAWNHVSMLRNGLQSHHERTKIMKFKDDSGNVAATDAVNAKIAD